MPTIEIFVESGKKKTFAGALHHPGWARSAKNEAEVLANLYQSAPRYAEICTLAGVDFAPPLSIADFVVVERCPGNSSTDFGGSNARLLADEQPLAEVECARYTKILRASWQKFDAVTTQAQAVVLRTGLRGGGRDLARIVAHLYESNLAYLRRVDWRTQADAAALRGELESAFLRAATGDLPATGSRGGRIWSARYFIRQVLWHLLDHIWEVEDRMM
ncbi:MAG: hypothetical protein OHK0052_03190 [Anaerolineales bacterium]